MPAKTIGAGQYAASLLSLIFNGTTYAGFATSAAGGFNNLYVSLHTSSAGLATSGGGQQTNEAAYTSYARVAVQRNTGTSGWGVVANTVTPVANITFPQATGGGETEAFFGVGTSAIGAGNLLYWGPISPTIAVSTNVTPILTNASSISES